MLEIDFVYKQCDILRIVSARKKLINIMRCNLIFYSYLCVYITEKQNNN